MSGLSLALVALAATACLAETPDLSGARTPPARLLSGGRMFNGQNWWTRFGEPVNAAALSASDGARGDVAPVAMYGHDYIYGPGACDCPPPCIDDLWGGYYQHPKRCDGYTGLFHRGHCGHCGRAGCDGGCGKGLGCGKGACGCGVALGCSKPVDSCCAPICGGGHLGHKWKHMKAHWCSRDCDSCAKPLGCGCSTPLAPFAPEVQVPSEKQALVRPEPLPEDAALIQLPRLNN
ncbi:MAG TPA: hypothetical protein VFB80_12390 [Pirellulaceae bacterium]|nr:hypothetical protein [Pirellulaceae bacterium]